MGLDMYLTGHRFMHSMDKPKKGSRERGEKKGELIDLGYWRKHPNLHGYIVQTFAAGEDECQEIDLSVESIHMILAAILADVERRQQVSTEEQDQAKEHDQEDDLLFLFFAAPLAIE
jgi:hypothetical protein